MSPSNQSKRVVNVRCHANSDLSSNPNHHRARIQTAADRSMPAAKLGAAALSKRRQAGNAPPLDCGTPNPVAWDWNAFPRFTLSRSIRTPRTTHHFRRDTFQQSVADPTAPFGTASPAVVELGSRLAPKRAWNSFQRLVPTRSNLVAGRSRIRIHHTLLAR